MEPAFLHTLLFPLFVVTGLSAQTLQVIDTEGHAVTLSTSQIATLPRSTVKVLDHDKPAEFEGVSLASVLSLAGVQLGDKLRGPRMTEVLLVEAADGYRVAFAVAETDPAFATREIILADKRDGKPLDAKEYRVRIKDGHNAVGLLVSTAGKRCIPATQFWLTVDACAAYRFPQNAALHVQVRLGNMGFTTVLEEIQDSSAKD